MFLISFKISTTSYFQNNENYFCMNEVAALAYACLSLFFLFINFLPQPICDEAFIYL